MFEFTVVRFAYQTCFSCLLQNIGFGGILVTCCFNLHDCLRRDGLLDVWSNMGSKDSVHVCSQVIIDSIILWGKKRGVPSQFPAKYQVLKLCSPVCQYRVQVVKKIKNNVL